MNAETNAETKDRPIALIVMGMARTGTSAITRVLSLCGATLPTGMVGADAGNPLGYWEPRAVFHLNESILRRHGSAAYDPTMRLQEEGAFSEKEAAATIAKIKGFFTRLPSAPVVVIKEIRINPLSGMWFEAARQAGLDVAAVIAVRHPAEVIASAAARYRFTPELTSALWLKFDLLAERHTRDIPRVFVEYTNLLDDWRREVKRISTALGVDLSTRDDSAIEDFLKPESRRQRECDTVTEVFGTDWMSSVYQALHAAARDEHFDESALDRVFTAYQATELAFRTASEDFHGHFTSLPSRLVRPSIAKLGLEVLAIAHGRRGVWA